MAACAPTFDGLNRGISPANIYRFKNIVELLTIYTVLTIMKIEHLFGLFAREGDYRMSENEKELIRIVRENDNPAQAIMAAALIIIGHLKQHESSEGQVVAGLPGHA